MSNISRIGGGVSKSFAIFAIVVLFACSSGRKRTQTVVDEPHSPTTEPNPPVAPNSEEVYGPFLGDVSRPAALENPDRVVLVLGPGLTHGYAYVGVLRGLQDLKVPVHAIYATEVGALISALYYTQPNRNRFDWALLRFTEKNLGPSQDKFSFQLRSPENELDGKLQEVFGDKRLESISDRLHISLQDEKTGESFDPRSGDLWRAIRGSLAGANRFGSTDFEGKSVRSSGIKISEGYRLARMKEKYPIIVVATGEPPTELFQRFIKEERATLLYVPLVGIDDLDLKKRNQAVFAGKTALQKAATEILTIVGRKSE